MATNGIPGSPLVHTTRKGVEIYDTRHPDNVFDPDGGRWVTVCPHGLLVNHRTRRLAMAHAAYPVGFCDEGCA